ncbi:hypothetical protein C8Q74DRAFT_363755 [Fomes fomentarius]|nr:hypothetical protein C8Q74DRAFT_363755 [Fomes fomentarius]
MNVTNNIYLRPLVIAPYMSDILGYSPEHHQFLANWPCTTDLPCFAAAATCKIVSGTASLRVRYRFRLNCTMANHGLILQKSDGDFRNESSCGSKCPCMQGPIARSFKGIDVAARLMSRPTIPRAQRELKPTYSPRLSAHLDFPARAGTNPETKKRPAPGTTPPPESEVNPTSGTFLTRGLLGSIRAALDVWELDGSSLRASEENVTCKAGYIREIHDVWLCCRVIVADCVRCEMINLSLSYTGTAYWSKYEASVIIFDTTVVSWHLDNRSRSA